MCECESVCECEFVCLCVCLREDDAEQKMKDDVNLLNSHQSQRVRKKQTGRLRTL